MKATGIFSVQLCTLELKKLWDSDFDSVIVVEQHSKVGESKLQKRPVGRRMPRGLRHRGKRLTRKSNTVDYVAVQCCSAFFLYSLSIQTDLEV